ncbi:MAG: hypothetical protein JWO30_2184 [Fibrobacteres bacterium]|nr:hypothetical protein [Fibrobacterota bacterium]
MQMALILCVASAFSAAGSPPPIPSATWESMDHSGDYLPAGKPKAQTAMTANATAAVAAVETPDGATVQVSTIDGLSVSMRKFNGRFTSMLLTQDELDIVGLARVRKLIDEHDIIYQTYKTLVATEPTGDALLRVVIVPTTTCGGKGGGCANPGQKDIEITHEVLYFPDYLHYAIHEIGHCFDRYSASIFSGADIAHAWTAYFDTFIMFQLGMSDLGLNAQDYLDFHLRTGFGMYENYPGATWAQCISASNCDPVGFEDARSMSVTAQGGAILRIASLYGKAAMQGWLTNVRAVIAERGEAVTDQDRAERLIESLSRTVGADLACFFDQWKWPMSAALRSRMAVYGANAFCADADLDGYSRLRHDCNDAAASIHPGAVETVNGKDDDCDGVIDDVLAAETTEFPKDVFNPKPVPFPVRITGSHPTGAGNVTDCLQITLAAADSLQFTYASKNTFQGWAQIKKQNSAEELRFQFVWPSETQTFKMGLGGGNWTVCSTVDQFGGDYELTIGKAYAYPMAADFHPVTFMPAKATANGGDKYSLPVPATPAALVGRAGLTAKYWISGFGDAGSIAATSTVPFLWTAPAGTNPLAPTYRVAFQAGGAPVHPWSQHQSLLGPAGWVSQDIGAVGFPGTLSNFGEQDLSVQASGADIWGTGDGFRFTWLPLTGNGEVTARILTLGMTNTAAKAGVMIRENLTVGSRNVFMGLMAGGQADFQVRSAAGGTTINTKSPATTPLWVKLARNGNVYTAFSSADGAAWSQLGAPVTIPMAASLYAGLAVSSHNNALVTTAGFGNVAVTSMGLPANWATGDIGATGVAGSATQVSGTFTVKGSGADIWGTADAFRYAYFPISGNTQLTVRLAALQNTDPWSKAGVMIRENLTAGSRNALMAASVANGVTFQVRTAAGGATTSTKAAGTVPKWLRIARVGSQITGYVSDNGAAWTQIGTQSIAMTANAFVGLAVTSHNNAALCAATLQNVTAN